MNLLAPRPIAVHPIASHPKARGASHRTSWFTAGRAACLGLVLCCASAIAQAGGAAKVSTSDGHGNDSEASVEFAGANLRLQTLPKSDGYVIVRDDKAYLVTQAAGVPVSLDLNAAMGAYGARLRALAGGSDGVREFVSLTDTGRRERVAGIEGDVYQLVYVDGRKERRRAELVLSHDPQVVEFTRSFRSALTLLQQASKVASPPGMARLEQTLDRQKLGVLRFADRYRLLALDRSTPPADRFTLPSQPIELPDLGPLQQLLGRPSRP